MTDHEPDHQPDPDGLRAVFNRLSLAGRTALRAANILPFVTGLMKDDVKRNPWNALFYSLVGIPSVALGFLPGPNPAVLALLAWIRWGRTAWAQEARGRLKREFSGAALAGRYRAFIEPDPEKPDHYHVKAVPLAGGAAARVWADVREAWKLVRQGRGGPPAPGNP